MEKRPSVMFDAMAEDAAESGRVQSRLGREIVATFGIPPVVIGPPPTPITTCPGCGQKWRGFDGDVRSACCGLGRVALIERLPHD